MQMSGETLDNLAWKIDSIADLLSHEDIKAAEIAFSELEQDIRSYFGDASNLKKNRIEECQFFYNKFSDLMSRTSLQKKNLAKSIGTHVNTQKKINAYKSTSR